jgi:hypothetical protein
MKIIRNVRSSESQEEILKYPNETHVRVNERSVDVDGSAQFEFDVVVVPNAHNYGDVKLRALAYYEKQMKVEKLYSVVITHNTVAYDADGRSIGNMSAVMGVANFKFNQSVAGGASYADAYQAIYKDSTIFWKGADNELHEVQIESVCEVLEKSMLEVANIIGATQ